MKDPRPAALPIPLRSFVALLLGLVAAGCATPGPTPCGGLCMDPLKYSDIEAWLDAHAPSTVTAPSATGTPAAQ